MKAYSKVLAVGAALMLVGVMAGSALAIEAFSERFEEDFSQPKTILARVVMVDPYEDAVWVNWVWKGVRNGGEVDSFWNKMLPGKNMRVFASGADLAALKAMARSAPGPAAATSVAPTTKLDVVEMTVHEAEQNRRVATGVKDVDDKLWIGFLPGGSLEQKLAMKVMSAQPGFAVQENKCGVVKGKPGVPAEALSAELPSGSGGKSYSKKSIPFGDYVSCVDGPPADPAPAAAPAAPAAAPAAPAAK